MGDAEFRHVAGVLELEDDARARLALQMGEPLGRPAEQLGVIRLRRGPRVRQAPVRLRFEDDLPEIPEFVVGIRLAEDRRPDLPVGVQLVGRFAQEYELLDFAEQLEKMPGFGFQRPTDLD